MSEMDKIAKDITVFNKALGDKIKAIQVKEASNKKHKENYRKDLAEVRNLFSILVEKLEKQEDTQHIDYAKIIRLISQSSKQGEKMVRMSSLLTGVILGIVLSAFLLIIKAAS